MKDRRGFVSNSSSSSFIIRGSSIEAVALAMHKLVMSDDETGKMTDEAQKKNDRLKILCNLADVQSGEAGVVFPSCNYDTYICIDGDDILISTSWNHDWDSCWPKYTYVIHQGGGEDYGDDDSCIGRMSDGDFHSLRGDEPLIKKGHIKAEPGINYKCPKCNDRPRDKPWLFNYYVAGADGKKYCPWHHVVMEEVTVEIEKE